VAVAARRGRQTRAENWRVGMNFARASMDRASELLEELRGILPPGADDRLADRLSEPFRDQLRLAARQLLEITGDDEIRLHVDEDECVG